MKIHGLEMLLLICSATKLQDSYARVAPLSHIATDRMNLDYDRLELRQRSKSVEPLSSAIFQKTHMTKRRQCSRLSELFFSRSIFQGSRLVLEWSIMITVERLMQREYARAALMH